MAATRDMTASLVLRLNDRLSGGLTALSRRLSGLAALGRRLAVVGAVAGGLSFAGPMQQAAAFEDQLRQNAITAGTSGQAAEEMIRRTAGAYERLALEVKQSSADIAAAAGTLVAANLSQDLIDQFLPVLGRTATATGASLQDLSNTAVALSQNLGIRSAEEMADALGALATAGKEGRFELRDMAQSFPQLTAAAEALGLRGREGVNSLAAMLQVGRKGAATSAEAANNLANFLAKITSPDAIKNFKEAGVDLAAVLKDATRQGINPVEAVIQKIRRLTGGDMVKMGELFGDMQVLNFLRPMIGSTQEYLDILKKARDANQDIISTDFATRSRGLFITLRMVEERWTQLTRRFSMGMAPLAEALERGLAAVQGAIERVDAAYPGLIEKGLAWIAGIVGAGAALGVLVPVLGFIGGGLAVLASPAIAAGAAIAAIAYAAYQVWQNWDRLPEFFAETWGEVQAAFDDFMRFLDVLTDGGMTAAVGRIKAVWEGLKAFFRGLWQGIQDAFNTAFGPILAVMDRINAVRERFAGGGEGAGAPAPTPEQARTRMGQRGAAGGFYAPEATAPGGGGGELRGRIAIDLAPGLQAREVEADRGLALPTGPDRGRTLGRP